MQIERHVAVGVGDLLAAVLHVEIERGLLGVVRGEQLAVERQRPRRAAPPRRALRDAPSEGRRRVDVKLGLSMRCRRRRRRARTSPPSGGHPRSARSSAGCTNEAIARRGMESPRERARLRSVAQRSLRPIDERREIQRRRERGVGHHLAVEERGAERGLRRSRRRRRRLTCTSSWRDSHSGASAPRACGPATSSPRCARRDRDTETKRARRACDSTSKRAASLPRTSERNRPERRQPRKAAEIPVVGGDVDLAAEPLASSTDRAGARAARPRRR